MDDKTTTEISPEIELALKALKAKYGDGIDQPAQDELPFDPPIEQPVSAAPEVPPAEPQPQEPPQQDDATLALKKQIESLRQSQQVRQQAAMEQQAVIAQLAANEERRQAWLAQTPGAKNHIPALGHIHRAALDAGLVDTSPEYFDFMGSQLAVLQAEQPAEHLAKEMQQRAAKPTPRYFVPLPAAPARNPSSLVSAPVSRSIPNGSGKRHSTGKVTLTPTEVEAARISGITPEEYAKEKIRYEGMREDGSYRDNRDQR
jgi:hypothetical protein